MMFGGDRTGGQGLVSANMAGVSGTIGAAQGQFWRSDFREVRSARRLNWKSLPGLEGLFGI